LGENKKKKIIEGELIKGFLPKKGSFHQGLKKEKGMVIPNWVWKN